MQEKGCVVLLIIIAGAVAAGRMASHGFKDAALWTFVVVAGIYGFVRFVEIIRGDTEGKLIDLIGFLAGGAVLGLCAADPELGVFPGMISGILVYGGVSLTGHALARANRLRRKTARPPVKHKPYNAKDRARDEYFKYDPRQFFGGNDDFFFDDDDYGYKEPPPHHGPSAPKGTLRLEHHVPKAYSTEEAVRMYQVSGIDDHPGHTNVALALATCCIRALGQTRGVAFLEKAARDESLPKRLRQTYIHALNLVIRSRK